MEKVKMMTEGEIKKEAARVKKVLASTPLVPPGVKTFDPRRFRRHARNKALRDVNRRLAEDLALERQSKKALSGIVDRATTKVRELQTIRGALRVIWRRLWRGRSQ